MTKVLATLGLVGSGVYVVVLVLLLGDRLGTVHNLALNEVGDFFAGLFGPLAIYWLILGFFQQGVELRQNTRALELQAEELHNSVEQQKALVEVSREHFRAELDALQFERQRQRDALLPHFLFKGVGGRHSGERSQFSSKIVNVGNTATSVALSCNRKMEKFSPELVHTWLKNAEYEVTWEYLDNVPKEDTSITINYVDAGGHPGEAVFDLVPRLEGRYPSVLVVPRRTTSAA